MILEDGHVFEGKSFGAQKEVICEVVFNTSMTGYLEVKRSFLSGTGSRNDLPTDRKLWSMSEDIESEKP